MISNTLPQSLIDNPILSQWIAFEEPGRVRVATGKVEIGQGILTALTQIAAEELDVRPEQVRLVSGQTDVSPAEGFTSGSYSIAVGGASIRLVCAEVRSLFLDRVAETLALPGRRAFDRGRQVPARRQGHRPRLLVDGGRDRARAPRERHRADQAAVDLPDRRQAPAAPRPAGEGHGRGLHPRHRARERAARPRAAAALARRASRRARRERGAQGRQGADRDPARGRVRRLHGRQRDRGDARRRGRAHARALGGRHAGARRRRRAGLAQGAAVARPHRRDRASPAAPRKAAMVEARYSRPFLTYGSIGPSCALAEFKDGALKVWSHSQGPAVLRDWLARALGLERAQVTVLHRQGAGAYGHNTADDAAFDASFIAMRMPGRTVRVQWSREDEFAVGADQHRHGDRAARRARRRQPAGRLDDRDLEPAARPAARHERQLQPDRRRGAAQRAAAATSSTTCRTSAAAAPPATRVAIYDLPRHRLIHHLLPRGAAAHLVAARARRLGQRVRDRSRSSTSWRRSPARTR